MKKNVVLTPEHLAMMMVANASDGDVDLLGIVRALYNYSHGVDIDNPCLTNAGLWTVTEIIEAQEE